MDEQSEWAKRSTKTRYWPARLAVIRRRIRSQITLSKLGALLFGGFIVLLTTAAPWLRDWQTRAVDEAVKEERGAPFWTNVYLLMGILFVGTLWTKYAESKRRKKRDLGRRILVNLSATDLAYRMLKRPRNSSAEVVHIRTLALQCVQMLVADVLGYEDSSNVMVSLLAFGKDESEMVVVARSGNSRPLGEKYESSTLVGYAAIKRHAFVVEHDIREDPKWGSREYSTVLAMPICINGEAVGVLSIDSKQPYDFFQVDQLIACLVEVYNAALSATFSKRNFRVKCQYRPRNLA